MGLEEMDLNEVSVFDIPPEVFDSLELVSFDSSTLEVKPSVKEKDEQAGVEIFFEEIKEKKVGSSEQCLTCKTSLEGLGEKRSHYKSDFHRLNLKRLVKGLEAITEDEFDSYIEQGSVESISGSEESDDEDLETEKNGETSRLDTIIEKMGDVSIDAVNESEGSEERTVSHLNTRTSLIYFRSTKTAQDQAVGVYKALFTQKQLLNNPKETLGSWCSDKARNGKSAILMIGGGHFAGAIISHKPKNIKGNVNLLESKKEQAVDIIASKSFHRYTTRKKQGGSQNANDNSKGKANSAGSTIRRYNEEALMREIRELLQAWKQHLDSCQSIYIRASGAFNRKVLVGYDGCVLKPTDERIRNVPVTTKRATVSEVKKVWAQISYLSVQPLPKVDLKQLKAIENRQIALNASLATNKKKVSAEVEESDRHTSELVALMKRSKAPMFISYIQKHKLSPEFELKPKENYIHHPMLLHYASSQGFSRMVHVLLVNLKADPTKRNSSGKTAYELANPTTKKAFQMARFVLGEDYCDWKQAKVGEPKSREQVEKEDDEEKQREAEQQRLLLEKERARAIDNDDSKKAPASPGHLLRPKGLATNVSDTSGLSDQQKQALMREQRARAAEARLKRMQK